MDQQPGAAVANDERELGHGEAVVERGEDDAGALAGDLDLDVLGLVEREEGDAVAGLDAPGEQGGGQLVGAAVDVGERERPLALHDAGPIGEARRRVPDEIRHHLHGDLLSAGSILACGAVRAQGRLGLVGGRRVSPAAAGV